MTWRERIAALDRERLGAEMHELLRALYPICRSITGDGVRETLDRIGESIALEVQEVPSGTAVFDWQVPPEWNIRDAWIRDAAGRKVVDFAASNLHVVSYSTPIRQRMSRAELAEHVHTLPDRPSWVPYRTSYYREDWGFCLSDEVWRALPDGDYEVCIDASLDAGGHLTYAEHVAAGSCEDEVLVSCHVCHPSLANDNLSGLVVTATLARVLADLPRRYTYRFVYLPGTIGSITWLARNESRVGRVRHGLVAANLGDPGRFHYKRSRRGDAEIDRAVCKVLADSGEDHEVLDFVPFGYDERQYCSPGFDLPVGSLTRTPWGRYPEYHTSADGPDLVTAASLAESLARYLEVFELLEGNRRYRNLNPKCEPQLGRRGLYRMLGGDEQGREVELALLWVLNLSDGAHSLLDIAERAAMPFASIRRAADALLAAELLEALD